MFKITTTKREPVIIDIDSDNPPAFLYNYPVISDPTRSHLTMVSTHESEVYSKSRLIRRKEVSISFKKKSLLSKFISFIKRKINIFIAFI